MAKQAYAVANDCEKFVNTVSHGQSEAAKQGAVFDSAPVFEDAPAVVQELADTLPTYTNRFGRAVTGQDAVLKATMDGVRDFGQRNGFAPSGGLIAAALQNAFATVSPEYRERMGIARPAVWDGVSNVSDSPMVANLAQLAIYQTITEALPFGGYVPMENGLIGKLIVAGHSAASKTGAYEVGDNLDGINSGKPFLSSNRTVKATDGGSQTDYTAKVLYAEGDSNGSPVIASSLQVLVNGVPAARTAMSSGRAAATAPIAGSVTLPVGGADKTYSVTGNLTTATGEVNITFSPALESAHEVHVVAALDYEHANMKGKRPEVRADAVDYALTAFVTSGLYKVSQEAKVQWNKEARLDPNAEAMYALRNQSAAERHFEAVRSMYRIGKNFVEAFDMKGNTRLDARSRASIFEDAFIAISLADQAMLARTNAFGIGVLYVGAKGKAYFESLPEPVFVKSGTTSHNGIHRVGVLQGKYQVFYVPGVTNETATSFEVLAIGRSSQIGLNPYIVGDVTGAIMMPLGVNSDLEEGMGYFQAGVGTINPHTPAALGAAVIQFTNVN